MSGKASCLEGTFTAATCKKNPEEPVESSTANAPDLAEELATETAMAVGAALAMLSMMGAMMPAPAPTPASTEMPAPADEVAV